jgi:hypothetical protein
LKIAAVSFCRTHETNINSLFVMCAKQETSAMTVGTIIALVSVYITAKDNYELFDDIVKPRFRL